MDGCVILIKYTRVVFRHHHENSRNMQIIPDSFVLNEPGLFTLARSIPALPLRVFPHKAGLTLKQTSHLNIVPNVEFDRLCCFVHGCLLQGPTVPGLWFRK